LLGLQTPVTDFVTYLTECCYKKTLILRLKISDRLLYCVAVCLFFFLLTAGVIFRFHIVVIWSLLAAFFLQHSFGSIFTPCSMFRPKRYSKRKSRDKVLGPVYGVIKKYYSRKAKVKYTTFKA